MRKATKTESAYFEMSQIDPQVVDSKVIYDLKSVINGTNSLLVSKAVDIAGQANLQQLIPDMVSAFFRFMVNGAKNDKQCNAKNAIAKALLDMNFLGDEIYLAGAHYKQMEPALGGRIDTATELRCNCAYGLAKIDHPDAHFVLTDLLVDDELVVRTAAAKALTYLGTPESELLLRLKVLSGKEEIEVISECFSGLMTMSPKRSLDFVRRFLYSDNPAVVECAALTIGQSHIPQAFEVLKDCWDNNIGSNVRASILLPIAIIRNEDAFDFLLKVLRASDTKLASNTLSALSLYADDESVNKIRQVVIAKGDDALLDKFDQEFML